MVQLTLTSNAQLKARRQKLEGREYLVAPVVMMVEGVHNGSKGPLLYSIDELRRSVQLWDHKPVVVQHPVVNGQPCSACLPEAIELFKVGMLLNTAWGHKNKKLHSECWMEISRLQAIAPGVLNSINRGEVVSVSTGLFADYDEAPGVWNGENYNQAVRNIVADHLAILPGEQGACSVQDGCGLLKNKDGTVLNKESDVAEYDCECEDGTTCDKCKAEEAAKEEKEEEVVENKKTAASGKRKAAPVTATTVATAPVTNKPKTVDDYINDAPEGFREVLRNGLNSYERDKSKLMKIITANKANRFSPDSLKTKTLEELQCIAALAAPTANAQPRIANYAGQADAADGEDDGEPLVAPTMNFENKTTNKKKGVA